MHDLVEELKAILAKYPQVLATYLYGSYSKGRQTPLSDIDLAVVTDDRGLLLEISADIAQKLEIPEERVSLVDLKLMDPIMRVKIIRSGVELVNRGLELSSITPQSWEVVEVSELEESACKSWLRGDPIDVEVVREVIVRVSEDLRDIEELLALGYERVMGDKHLRKSFERTVHTLIESTLDLLRHIVAGLSLGVAAYYKDYVDYVERFGIVSSDVTEGLRRVIPIRHALVHKYRGINYKELWRVAEELRAVVSKLINEVRASLRERHGIEVH